MLQEWTAAAAGWLPSAIVAVLALLAMVEALVLRPRRRGRLRWLGIAILLGGAAVWSTLWQRRIGDDLMRRQAAQLDTLSRQLAEIGDVALPAAGTAPSAGQSSATLDRLQHKMQVLKDEISALQQKYDTRTIDPATATKIADYLRPFGSHRVVVSCIPGNVEAYDYANQIATILRAAGWDAPGPQTTELFGTTPAMGVSLYVNGDPAAAEAKTLTDAFAKFNVPYRSRIAPNADIPDAKTVELFVAAKPPA